MHLATLTGDLGGAIPMLPAWFAATWQPAAAALAASIWQAAVIVCGLEIALRLMPRISAMHRFAVWMAGFVVAVGLPWLPLMHFGSGRVESGEAGAGSAGGPLLELDERWVLAIIALWIGAAALRATDLALHAMRLRRMWKAAQPVEVSEALRNALKAVRGGRVAICTTEMLDRPSVIGFWAPRILIPAWLMARLSAGELKQVVLHEAEHLRRGDDWTNLAQKLALVAFPLSPALVWMEHRLCLEREMACDEGVVRITHAPRAYAACLASLAERGLERRTEALSLGAWQRRPELVQRVHGILWRKCRLSRGASIALLSTLGCALLGGAVEMARCPQLVEFVPAQNSAATTPVRQREMTAMLARENAEAKIAMQQGFRAVPARAVISETTTAGKHVHHVDRRNAVPLGLHATVGASQVAQADLAGDRVNGDQGQQWVVLAAFEEVRTVSPTSSNAISDFATKAVAEDGAAQPQNNGTTAGQASNKTLQSGQPGGRYTVTRLILRVVPAKSSSNATQPAQEVVRGGWFVIQL